MTPAGLHSLHVISYNGHQSINVLFMFDDAVHWYIVLSGSQLQ